MSDLSADQFRDFFADVHGYVPFPWQQRLTERVLDSGTWPEVIDLPTGTGKTAVLDTAIYSLAARPDVTPRRIVFVIDRRIVVDQVCDRARHIRDRIRRGKTPILQTVRDRLAQLCGGDPLEVSALRGGIPLDTEWTRRPDRPWVLVSTVDQFGSRLLFRGYGVGSRTLPVNAGLAGNDCLVILDEVHLSAAFAETLDRVARLPHGDLPRRFQVVSMSATPGADQEKRFSLDPVADIEECEELRRRVRAPKQAELKSVASRKALPVSILKLVRSISKRKDGITSVGIVLNRVETARQVYSALDEDGFAAHLVTGRMRPLDRAETLKTIGPLVDPDGTRQDDGLAIVVATQAIEVGADFSFDAMITECASWNSLRQRFGRLDRRGSFAGRAGIAAPAWILSVKPEISAKRSDPIYGESLKATWKALSQLAEQGPIDVSLHGAPEFPPETAAPVAQAPLLLQTHMDAWVQTKPRPIVDPPIEWFLHGMQREGVPEVSIAWRRDRTTEALRLVPPRQAEILPLPINAARAWLSGEAEMDVADVQLFGRDDFPTGSALTDRVRRWNGFANGAETVDGPRDIRPGDVLLVDPARGGLCAGTWDPNSTEPVEDLGDAAQAAHRRRATLRLDPELDYGPMSCFPRPGQEIDPDTSLDPDTSVREAIVNCLAEWAAEAESGPDWLSRTLQRLRRGFDCQPVDKAEGGAGRAYYVLTERHHTTKKPIVDPTLFDGSDEAGSMTGSSTTLQSHLDGVAALTREFAGRLGLPSEIVEDLALAGALHDLGKVDPRFQEQLVGGDPVALALQADPLAKSQPGVRRVRRYPHGMRHEMASVALACSDAEVLAGAHDADLVLHLIATHHGWARPLPPIIADPEPRELEWTLDGIRLAADSDLTDGPLALDMVDRFWRLVERYGYYGLAWLEAILRLADWQRSAAEEAQQ